MDDGRQRNKNDDRSLVSSTLINRAYMQLAKRRLSEKSEIRYQKDSVPKTGQRDDRT